MRSISHNPEETEKIAAKLLSELAPDDARATVVGLIGDLGSGKTTFVQTLAKQLGIVEAVTSPTFVIEKFYQLDNKKFKKLVHIDAYRLNSPEELLKLNWGEVVAEPNQLVLVEWADKIESILPAGTRRVRFTFIDDQTREINF